MITITQKIEQDGIKWEDITEIKFNPGDTIWHIDSTNNMPVEKKVDYIKIYENNRVMVSCGGTDVYVLETFTSKDDAMSFLTYSEKIASTNNIQEQTIYNNEASKLLAAKVWLKMCK